MNTCYIVFGVDGITEIDCALCESITIHGELSSVCEFLSYANVCTSRSFESLGPDHE